ncbi:hypothetical protein BDW02DRAFT_570700 [Decorospora gaudefroyi]|uniref:Uncharacterized protein n=1 Tax=Decorospora gaudefroyi TaxID=184978 RepID=A0A6A5K6E5_9PLEO|nr:hypothetical protein BDW02DRAFT_570700 [Decorospora gaudefroyi]
MLATGDTIGRRLACGVLQDKCRIKEPPRSTFINSDRHVYIGIFRQGASANVIRVVLMYLLRMVPLVYDILINS